MSLPEPLPPVSWPARQLANPFTRMFPRLARTTCKRGSKLENGLRELGEAMLDDGGAVKQGRSFAGFTYLGQFIDHDLTLDLTSLGSAHVNNAGMQNFRSPFLNLDHVYGGGPMVSPRLYDMNYPAGEERFLIGRTKRADARDGRKEDLPRDDTGIALTADPRQDENLIIAQLHVAFLKLHNLLIANPRLLGQQQDQAPNFAKAQRLVTWTYQYIVLKSYLPTVLNNQILDAVLQSWISRGETDAAFRIPIEFSAAAFRFGHSMVRDHYPLFNDFHPDEKHPAGVDLACLFALTGTGHGRVPCSEVSIEMDAAFALPDDWVIDWKHFFKMPASRTAINQARRIDTAIAKGLHHLGDGAEPHLPVRTLLRSARMGLPTGQDVAGALNIHALNESEVAPDGSPHTEVLRKHGFHRKTPLWYYILREAELVPDDGDELGPLGSRIVAEVVVGAVRSDPGSYLACNPSWVPKLGDDLISGMADLLEFILEKS